MGREKKMIIVDLAMSTRVWAHRVPKSRTRSDSTFYCKKSSAKSMKNRRRWWKKRRRLRRRQQQQTHVIIRRKRYTTIRMMYEWRGIEARSVLAAQCIQNEECRSAEIKINNNIKNNKSTLQRHNNKHSFRFDEGNCIERAICVRTRAEWCTMMHERKTKEMHCRRRLSETVHSVISFYIYFVYFYLFFFIWFSFRSQVIL